ncbi:MAG TPA: thioredoxin family protein [Solirubrobacteraceae bacterium]|nr:thioredoxin family protein [Solirubrobacteraceae bacterium]
MELLALVKHDCPVCDQVLPVLDAARQRGAAIRILSQSGPEETEAQAQRLNLAHVPELDRDLKLSARFDPDAVPTLVLLDGGSEADRVEGLDRARLAELARRAGAPLELDGLPERRPGCASLTRDPVVAARLAARAARETGRLRARELELGELEDPFEALFDRGFSDGLPLVPPTPERVVDMLDATSRDAQDLVAAVPPYDGQATVEKVAINAVMAGCPPAVFPILLAAVDAACDPAFALLGLVSTTHPSGPLVVVSGPLSERVGMNSAGNALGQGNRATLTVGRALQLVVRNVGGGRPGQEDRAAHGQPGKLSSCFAERLEDSPWPGLAQDRGVPPEETGVTLVAAEAPRVIVDQLARTPWELCASLAGGLEWVGHRRLRLAFDAVLVLGPEHGRILREAGWDRDRVRQELFERSRAPAGELVRGAGGIAEGLEERFVTDPAAPVPKFAAPERILLAHAGGDAGLFSMVYGGWVAGEIGSEPVTRSVAPWQ